MTAGSLRSALVAIVAAMGFVGPGAAAARADDPAAALTATVSDTLSGTAAHPREVQVGLDTTIAPGFPAAAGARAVRIDVGLADFAVGAALDDPGCPPAQVLADDALCPAGSLVGGGSLDFDLPIGAEHVAVAIYRSATADLQLLFTGTGALAFRHTGLGGLDGFGALHLGLPLDVAAPLGLAAQLRRVRLTLGSHRPGLPGWVATTSCSPIGWWLSTTVSASDGTAASPGSARLGCQPGSYVEPSLTIPDSAAGTPGAPKSVTATVALTATPEWPAPWADGQLDGYALAFGPGIALGAGPGDPSCGAEQVALDDGACPVGSRVASGTLKLGHGGADPLPVRVYNAPGGRTVNVLTLAPAPHVVTGTLDAAGRTLSVPVPRAIAEPDSGHFVGMRSLTLTFQGGGGPGWLRTVGCPGAWTLAAELEDGGLVETGPQASVACTAAVPAAVAAPKGEQPLAPPAAAAVAAPAPVTAAGAAPKATILRALPPLHVAFRTRAHRLLGVANLTGLPAGTRVTLRCRTGCALHRSYVTRAGDARGRPRLAFRPLTLTAATRLEVSATRAGYRTQTITYKFVSRRGKLRAVAV